MTVLVVLAVIFVALIPLNWRVAIDVLRFAWPQPRQPLLVLLSRLVTVLALVATVAAVVAVSSVLVLAVGVRLIPNPIPLIALVAALLTASAANVLVWRYLRSKLG